MGTGFGVANAYGNLRRVLMHRPGDELSRVTPETLAEFHFERPVDPAAFVAEYDVMAERLAARGAEILWLGEILAADDDALGYIRHRPNMTYTRDLAVVFAGGAVLMSPHLKGRWGDERMMGRAFERLGVPVLGAVEPPGFLEGGGVTLLGEDTVVVSVCDRANRAGTRMLRELTLGSQVRSFVEVPLPFGHIHIDGVFMVVDSDLAVIYPDSFRALPAVVYEDGRSEPRHAMFEELLDERGMRTIPITREERDHGHLNVVVTERGRTAVGFAGADRLGGELARHGFELQTFPADELFRGNGGAHCMTCPVEVR